MSAPIWISLLTLMVGSIVTLSVAAMHRKQMRQIELHRADPSIPLVPPPHPITLFLRNHAFFLLSIAINVCILVKELRESTPITRSDVFSIALAISATFALVLMELGTSILDRSLKLIGRTMDVTDKIIRVLADKDSNTRS
jgi:hypothetical protein